MSQIVMKDLHNKLLELINVFHTFCEERGLKYIATGGTCLGAVRHDGFIPWDDDADVAMPRHDYDIFIKECKKGALPEGFTLQCYGDGDPHYNDNWVRLRIDNTLCIIPYHKSLGWKHLGVFLDIFPYEPSSFNNIKLIKKYKRRYDILSRCFSNKVAPTHPSFKSKLFNIFLLPFKAKKLYLKREICFKKMSKQSPIICYIDFNTPYGLKKGIFGPGIFDKRILHKFENSVIYIPLDYDDFLTVQFGDYHKLPPENERVGHLPEIIEL